MSNLIKYICIANNEIYYFNKSQVSNVEKRYNDKYIKYDDYINNKIEEPDTKQEPSKKTTKTKTTKTKKNKDLL